MCLIAVIPARKDRTRVSNAWLEDVFRRNSDGFGFMWSERGRAKATRAVGKVEDFKAAFRKHERNTEGEFAVHLRYKTHGKVDVTNAHPYPVDTPRFGRASVYMMHNGVLHTGNSANPAMSDTWHFINDYIRGMVNEYGEGILERREFRMLVEDMIGSNRFVFLGRSGKLNIYNKDQGIMWRGMWLSNTYAWSAEKFGAVKPKVRTTGYKDRWTPNYPTYSGGSLGNAPGGSLVAAGAAAPRQGTLALPAHKSASESADVFGLIDNDDEYDEYGIYRGGGLWDTSSTHSDGFDRTCVDDFASDYDEDDFDEAVPIEDFDWTAVDTQVRDEAKQFIAFLDEWGYADVASALSEDFVAGWIRQIGWAEYTHTFHDIQYGYVDPAELFAQLVSEGDAE